jgi:hypothetical protein
VFMTVAIVMTLSHHRRHTERLSISKIGENASGSGVDSFIVRSGAVKSKVEPLVVVV